MRKRLKISKHARQRFYERIGYMTDEEILFTARMGRKGFEFIWDNCVLITVIPHQCLRHSASGPESAPLPRNWVNGF